MIPDQQTFWNERFSQANHALFGDEPNDFLRAVTPKPEPNAMALTPGDGDGRNGVWLAQQGYTVTSLDVSDVALTLAEQRAKAADVALKCIHTDLLAWGWPQGYFDLVAVVFIHVPGADTPVLFKNIIQALKPGGTLIVEGYHPDQIPLTSGGPKNPDMLWTPEQTFEPLSEQLSFLLCQDVHRYISESARHMGPARTTQVLAIKK